MRKCISATLICALLLICLSSCSFLDAIRNAIPERSDNTPDSNVTNDGSVKNDEDNGTEITPEFKGIPIENDSDIVKAIVDLLYNRHTDHDMHSGEIEYKLYSIEKHGAQLLEITFNPWEYYFVCGYENQKLTSIHQEDYRAKNCTWFKFDSADEIPEYYNDEKCVFAFQVNKSSSIINLLGNDSIPKVDHFLDYEPEFSDGFNTAYPLVFGETIYYVDTPGGFYGFDHSADKINYYSTALFYNPWLTLFTIEIDGTICIKIPSKTVDGDSEVGNIELRFGEYYELFTDVIYKDAYMVKHLEFDSCMYFYSCIKIDDFVKVVNEKILFDNYNWRTAREDNQ